MIRPQPSLVWLGSLLLAIPVSLAAAEPQWIWSSQNAAVKAPGGDVYFRKLFEVAEPESAQVQISADNQFELLINGREIGRGDNWQERRSFDIKPFLTPGANLIAVRATNDGESPAGLAVRIVLKSKGQPEQEVLSDASWKFTLKPTGNWARPEFETGAWSQAFALGAYGKTAPWGGAGNVVAGTTAPVLNAAKSTEVGQFQFRDGDRVVFLGGAMVERMQIRGYLETMLTQANPGKNITFRNLGWSGDTVWGDARAVFGSRSDGFKRLKSDLALCQPTAIIVCYGENEAFEGEAGLPGFQAGLNTLLDALEGSGARLVLLAARKHENLGAPLPDPAAYNAQLKQYNEALAYAAESRKHTFVDLFDFAPGERLTENGLHFSPLGEYAIAAELAARLGAAPRAWSLDLDLSRKSLDVSGASLLTLERTESGAILEIQPATLPPPAGPSEATAQLASAQVRIRGLPSGNYALRQNGAQILVADADAWSKGLRITPAGEREQIGKLEQAIQNKNLLFFHRHRPQNETYLFLFRKHEQGNNAVEIPQFDPLIVAHEKEIAVLRKPARLTWELVKTNAK